MAKLTADTITDEQIRELQRVLEDEERIALNMATTARDGRNSCVEALYEYDYPTSRGIARARCVEIWNARNEVKPVITHDMITDDDIRVFRDEARAVGDRERARASNAALGLPTSDGALGCLDKAVCRARVADLIIRERTPGTIAEREREVAS